MKDPCPRLRPLLGLALLALASGCSNNPYPAGQSAESVSYRMVTVDPKSLDPGYSFSLTDSRIIDVIYPSYFRFDYLKRGPDAMELNLGAAPPARRAVTVRERDRSGQSVARKGEEWTFRIKKGIRFQDDPCFPGGNGREVTAADFLYSLRRMADPNLESPVVQYFEDNVAGFHDYVATSRTADRPDYAKPVEGLRLDPQDPYVFRLRLRRPYPQLKYLMAMHFTAPVPHEAVEKYGKEIARRPVGCGPYRLTEFTPKKRIVLETNPTGTAVSYPDAGEAEDRGAGLLADAGKPLPRTGKLVFPIIRERVTGWNLFQQGYLDSFSVDQDNYQQAMTRAGDLSDEMKRRGIRLLRDNAANTYYFAFNMEDSLVGGYTPEKRKLRQAISLAFDANAFIDLQSQGQGTPAHWIVPPGIAGYDESYRNPYRQFDPRLTRAKQLLAEAGYPGGIDPATGERLTLRYENAGDDAAGRQFTGHVVKQVEALGLRLEPRTLLPAVLADRLHQGDFQFILATWWADYPDAEDFALLFFGPNKRPGPNVSAYHNEEFDRLYDRMRSMDDGPERSALLAKMRALMEEDCPIIPVEHKKAVVLTHSWLTNVKSHPVANDVLQYQGVDGGRRAEMQALWNRPNYWPAAAVLALLISGSWPAATTIRRHRRRHVRRTRRSSGGENP